MTMLERVKAMPLPEPYLRNVRECGLAWTAPQICHHREQIAKEADERIERLCVALQECSSRLSACRLIIEDDEARHMAAESVNAARAALAEARKP